LGYSTAISVNCKICELIYLWIAISVNCKICELLYLWIASWWMSEWLGFQCISDDCISVIVYAIVYQMFRLYQWWFLTSMNCLW
jgi:hypothetical protein